MCAWDNTRNSVHLPWHGAYMKEGCEAVMATKLCRAKRHGPACLQRLLPSRSLMHQLNCSLDAVIAHDCASLAGTSIWGASTRDARLWRLLSGAVQLHWPTKRRYGTNVHYVKGFQRQCSGNRVGMRACDDCCQRAASRSSSAAVAASCARRLADRPHLQAAFLEGFGVPGNPG